MGSFPKCRKFIFFITVVPDTFVITSYNFHYLCLFNSSLIISSVFAANSKYIVYFPGAAHHWAVSFRGHRVGSHGVCTPVSCWRSFSRALEMFLLFFLTLEDWMLLSCRTDDLLAPFVSPYVIESLPAPPPCSLGAAAYRHSQLFYGCALLEECTCCCCATRMDCWQPLLQNILWYFGKKKYQTLYSPVLWIKHCTLYFTLFLFFNNSNSSCFIRHLCHL